MLHHGSVGVNSKVKKRNLTLTLTITLNLLLLSIVFHNKICVVIMIFTALSSLRLIHGLSFIWGGNVKETLTQVFSFEFCEISKNTFFKEHLRTTTSVSLFVYSISFFIKARIPLQFLSQAFSILYMFSPFSFVFMNALITST